MISEETFTNVMSKVGKPLYQALFAIGLGVSISIVTYVISNSGGDIDRSFYWTICGAMCLMYSFFASIISLGDIGDWEKYIGKSILFYFLTLAFLSGVAYLFSGVWFDKLEGFYLLIFGMLTFGFLVFCAIAGFIKRLLILMDKEEAYLKEQSRKKRGL